MEQAMVALAKVRPWMSVAEFLQWDSGAGEHRRWQLVDGEPRAMAPAKPIHGYLQAALARLIGNHLLASDSPCNVFAAPGVVPAIMSAHNMRVPDLAVSCTPQVPDRADLADPVLIVEILSRSNRTDTWANVWAYTTMPSVREILILHADTVAAELLARQPDGSWPERPILIAEGALALASIGLPINLAELYARTPLAPG
jgi:Uma2 family endonuclease